VKSRLKEILDQRGIKYIHVANQVGINKSTMSRIVNGESTPSLQVAYRIAKFLNMPIEEIWYEDKRL
jgi:putative transcriptional regulator